MKGQINSGVVIRTPKIKIISKISVDEMISIFLSGEIDSQRFRHYYIEALKASNHDVDIIYNPNLKSKEENFYRLKLLGDLRGFGRKKYLFENFPEDTDWYRAYITAEELLRVKYIDFIAWTRLARGSRLPIDAARNIEEGTVVHNDNIEYFKHIAKAIENGAVLPPLILVSTDERGEFVVLEGHARLTAYALARDHLPERLEVIVGLSKDMYKWGNFSMYPEQKGLPNLYME